MLKTGDVSDMNVPGEGRKVVQIIAQSLFDVNEESIESAALVDSRNRRQASLFSQDELPLSWFLQANLQGLRAEEHQEGGLTGEPLR